MRGIVCAGSCRGGNTLRVDSRLGLTRDAGAVPLMPEAAVVGVIPDATPHPNRHLFCRSRLKFWRTSLGV